MKALETSQKNSEKSVQVRKLINSVQPPLPPLTPKTYRTEEKGNCFLLGEYLSRDGVGAGPNTLLISSKWSLPCSWESAVIHSKTLTLGTFQCQSNSALYKILKWVLSKRQELAFIFYQVLLLLNSRVLYDLSNICLFTFIGIKILFMCMHLCVI